MRHLKEADKFSAAIDMDPASLLKMRRKKRSHQNKILQNAQRSADSTRLRVWYPADISLDIGITPTF